MKREKSDAVDFQTDPRANGSTPNLNSSASSPAWRPGTTTNNQTAQEFILKHTTKAQRGPNIWSEAPAARGERNVQGWSNTGESAPVKRGQVIPPLGYSETLSCARFYIHHKTLEQLSETHQSVKCLTGHVSPAHGVRLSIWACVQPDSALNHNLAVQVHTVQPSCWCYSRTLKDAHSETWKYLDIFISC